MSLVTRLRLETRDDHDRIELAFDLDRRLASRESYRDLLVRLHGFHRMFESAAAPRLSGSGFGAHLDRAGTIAADIAALDRESGEAGPSAGPGPGGPDLGLADRAEAVGALYVVEGSILGGVLIARQVRTRLGLSAGSGCGFFSGHGRETAAHWAGFCRLLEGETDRSFDDAAVASARLTYGAMGGWLRDDARPAA